MSHFETEIALWWHMAVNIYFCLIYVVLLAIQMKLAVHCSRTKHRYFSWSFQGSRMFQFQTRVVRYETITRSEWILKASFKVVSEFFQAD